MISLLKQVVVWFGLLCMVFSFLGCGGPEERKMKYYEKGKVFWQKGEYQNARLELKNAVQVDPAFVDGYFLLGKIEFEDKKINQGVKYFNKVLKLSPEHIDARLMLAEMGLLAKEYDYALKNVKEVLDIQPGNVKAQIIEGFILTSTGKKPQARGIAEKLLAGGHNDPDLYIILASTYSWENEKQLIEDIYKQGLSKNAESGRLLRALINLFISEKRNEEAVHLFENLIEKEPDTVLHQFSLAQLYWSMGRPSDAEQIIDKISAAGHEKEEVTLLSANFYTMNKMYDSAERILLDALKQKPENFKYRFALSDLYVMQGKNQEAIKTLEQQLLLNKDKKSPNILKTQNVLARIYLALGDNDKALEYVEKVIAANQQDREAHFTKGKIFLTQGEGDKAVTEFRLIITENPQFIEGHLRLAEAHVINKSYEQAIDGLQQALEMNAGSKEILRGLALVFLLKEDKKAAETQLRKILELYPEDVQTHLDLADLFSAQGEFAAAEFGYNNLATLVPTSPTPYLRLSRLLWRDGRKQEAVSVLEGAQKVNNTSSQEIFSALVQLYIQQEQFDKASERCLQKQQDDPDNPFYYYMMGQVYTAYKKYESAEEEFNKAIALAPLWPAPQNGIAGLYYIQGKTGEAINKLEEVVAKEPENQGNYVTLALLYEKQGNYVKAIQTYERTLAINPENWVIANNLSYMLMDYQTDKSSMEKALELAEKARRLRPQSVEVADTLSWAYFKNENFTKALTIIEEAFPIPPENPTMLFHRGAILYKNGKIAEAKESVLRSLEGEEDFNGRKEAESLLENIVALAE